MHGRRTFGLVLLGLGLATAAAAAESAALADAAEHRDWVGVRTLLQKNAADVNTAPCSLHSAKLVPVRSESWKLASGISDPLKTAPVTLA